MRPIHILSIDGGGIRGVLPAAILTEIENRTGQPICSLFDLISGTSTGGILAVGLTVPAEDGEGPKFKASELGALYDQKGEEIFDQSFWQKMGSVADNAFGHENIERLLKEFFGDAMLSDALTQVIITSYEIEKRQCFYFNSDLAKKDKSEDFLIREVARATSAAPTYFEPTQVGPLGNQFALVDGGVYANNPSMLAYVEAKTYYQALKNKKASTSSGRSRQVSSASVRAMEIDEPFVMVSLGTGSSLKPYPYKDAKDWGLVGWVRPITDILMQGVSETVDYQMKRLLPPRLDGSKRYYRFTTKLQPEHSDMSDASPEMITALKEYAAGIIRREDKAIDELCAQLTK